MTADAFRVCDEKFESSLKAVVTKLRAEQKQALLHLITRRDVFVNLSTGFGKSPIYQLVPSIVEEVSHLDLEDSQCNHSGDLSSGVLDERSSTIFAAKRNKSFIYRWGTV